MSSCVCCRWACIIIIAVTETRKQSRRRGTDCHGLPTSHGGVRRRSIYVPFCCYYYYCTVAAPCVIWVFENQCTTKLVCRTGAIFGPLKRRVRPAPPPTHVRKCSKSYYTCNIVIILPLPVPCACAGPSLLHCPGSGI